MKIFITSFDNFSKLLPTMDSNEMSMLHSMIAKNDYTGKTVAYIPGVNSENALLGVVIFSSKDKKATIHTLCVRDCVKHRGIGTKLVDTVKAGNDFVSVNGIRDALGFYIKNGFIPKDDILDLVVHLEWNRQTESRENPGTRR